MIRKATRKPEKPRQTRWLQFLVMSCVMMVFFLPIIQQRFNLFHYQQLDENRQRKLPPSCSQFTQLPEYTQKLDAYLKDSFGFRDLLIRIKNQIDLSVFGVSEKVYINPEGRLFYREFEDRYRPEMAAATPEHWQKLFEEIRYLHKYLSRQGITLLVVPVPLADSIYPEQFPKLRQVGFSQRLYQRFFRFFDEENIPYVDLTKTLLPHKAEPLYYKTDFHYTGVAGFYANQAILNKLYALQGSKKQWNYPLSYKSQPFSGVLNDYLAVFKPLPDENPVVKTTWPVCSKEGANAVWKNICPGSPSLPPTVAFANSFMVYILNSGFGNEFPVLYINLVQGTEKMSTKIAHLPQGTKFVIVEFYETDVWAFLFGDVFPKIGSLDKP